MYIKYNIITRAYCEKGVFVIQSKLSLDIIEGLCPQRR